MTGGAGAVRAVTDGGGTGRPASRCAVNQVMMASSPCAAASSRVAPWVITPGASGKLTTKTSSWGDHSTSIAVSSCLVQFLCVHVVIGSTRGSHYSSLLSATGSVPTYVLCYFPNLTLLDGLANLVLLIPLGVLTVLARERDCQIGLLRMRPNCMRTFAASRQFNETRSAEIRFQLPDLARHLGPPSITEVMHGRVLHCGTPKTAGAIAAPLDSPVGAHGTDRLLSRRGAGRN